MFWLCSPVRLVHRPLVLEVRRLRREKIRWAGLRGISSGSYGARPPFASRSLGRSALVNSGGVSDRYTWRRVRVVISPPR